MNIYYCYWIDTNEEFEIFGYSYADAIRRANLEKDFTKFRCEYSEYADWRRFEEWKNFLEFFTMFVALAFSRGWFFLISMWFSREIILYVGIFSKFLWRLFNMKIENMTIKRQQIIFSDPEFSDILNARRWLKNSLQFTENNELQRAVDALEVVLDNIGIHDGGNYYILSEEIRRDDA